MELNYSAAEQLSGRSIDNSAYRYSVGSSATTNYSANGLNQYASVGGTSYSYDARGNLTSDGSRSFAYDNDNELTSVSGSATMTLAYDPAGRLRQTVTPGGGAGTPTNWGAANWGAFQWSGATYVTQNYVYDGDALAVEYDDAGNIVRRYVPGPGPDEPLVWYEGSGLSSPHWLHTDEQGSVIATSDGSGNGTPYVYSATGEPTAWGTPGSVPAFRYTGQMALPQVQLMYYKARMYDPALGRFLQTDPAGYAQGLNLYAYAANNYPNATDPSGLCPFWVNDVAYDDGQPSCPTIVATPNPSSGWSPSMGGGFVPPINNSPNPSGGGSQAIATLSVQGTDSAKREQIRQMCVRDFNSSGVGETINFISPLSLLLGPDPGKSAEETVGFGSLKYGAVKGGEWLGTKALTQVVGTASWAALYAAGKLSAGVKVAARVVGLPGVIYSSGLQALAHLGCLSLAQQETGLTNPYPVAP